MNLLNYRAVYSNGYLVEAILKHYLLCQDFVHSIFVFEKDAIFFLRIHQSAAYDFFFKFCLT